MNTLTDKRILVIGLGHMATALVKGLLKVDSISKKHIYAVTHGERSQNNAQELGINPIENTDTLKVDIVLLALKPQMMADVLPKYKHLVSKDTLFFSVAAGVSLDNITALLGAEAQVIRAMPNTPTAVGAGITALYAPDSISQAHKISAEAFFSASGSYIWLTEEEQMHAVTALSGSGPAYFFYFIEAL
ncbi:MAG: pyrroline-5-carboxylate reductase, partial [bacterium]